MNLKQAKKLRKLVFGPVGQGKVEYATVNRARGRRVTVEGAPVIRIVKNCFFNDITQVRPHNYEDIFEPTGTVQCEGPRRIYQIMKARGVTK